MLSSVKLFYPRYNTSEIIEKLKDGIEKIKNVDILKVVLFGSYSKGNYTGRSDIDVFFLVRKKNKNLYKIIKKNILLFNLQPHIFTDKEYLKMKEKFERMLEKGIIVFEKRD
ncbi:MAG: nucleotidyltransferase domain-containing protein [bacterium]|nr:nucleotidyltransferase domain-containing protein [bacterium]MDW8164227.1 nucleotidyltransferase domain-containing protein [Candidatus Omnitrophota bacterium]